MGKTFAKIVSLLGEWSVCTYGIFGPYGVGEIQIYQDGIFCPDFGTKKISGFAAIDGSAMATSFHHLTLEDPGPLMDADEPLMEEPSSRFFAFASLAPLRETPRIPGQQLGPPREGFSPRRQARKGSYQESTDAS